MALRLVGLSALLAILLGLTAGDWGRGATTSATGAWRPLRDAGLERTEVGAARIGRFIYVVGGFVSPGSTTDAVERYDLRRNRWRRLPPMPVAVNHPAVTAHRGFLYVYGGYVDSSFSPVTAALQRYDPRRNRWVRLRESPTARAAAGLAAIGRRLFAVGGAGEGGALTTLEVYDVVSRRWRSSAPMRVPREHIAAVASRGRLYVFGGRQGARNLDVVERFDPRRGRWSRQPSLLHSRSGFAAVDVRGHPVVFGGEELTPGGETIRPVELFDPERRRWRQLPGMRTPRHGLGGAVQGRRVYALQGGPTPGFDFSGAIEFLDVPGRLLRR
ncbi:MAG TPA: kelch repeat-containing protein [Solirubrobacterales bacterium]